MNKKVVSYVFVFSLVVLLSVSLVSAGWLGDLFGKITGKVVADGLECNTNSECSSGYCNLESGAGVGICEFAPVEKPALDQITCTDSDGGKDYHVKGNVQGIDGNGVAFDFPDFCTKDGLFEYWCKTPDLEGDQLFYWEYYECPNGCFDGACQLLANGLECNSNGECDSDYCNKNTGMGVGICGAEEGNAVLAKDYNSCSSCITSGNEWCATSSEAGQCFTSSLSSECDALGGDLIVNNVALCSKENIEDIQTVSEAEMVAGKKTCEACTSSEYYWCSDSRDVYENTCLSSESLGDCASGKLISSRAGCSVDKVENEVVVEKSLPNMGNKKDMSKYSKQEVFLISDKDWRDVLPLVPLTTWTQQKDSSKINSLILNSFDIPILDSCENIISQQDITELNKIYGIYEAEKNNPSLNLGDISFSDWFGIKAQNIPYFGNFFRGLGAYVNSCVNEEQVDFLGECQRGYGTPENVCVYPTLVYRDKITLNQIEPFFWFIDSSWLLNLLDLEDGRNCWFQFLDNEYSSCSLDSEDFEKLDIKLDINNFDDRFSVGEVRDLKLIIKNPSLDKEISFKIDEENLYLSDSALSIGDTVFFDSIFVELDEIGQEITLLPGQEIILNGEIRFVNPINERSIDLDSPIYFMQQFDTEKVTIVGQTSQELDNLLIAEPELGAGVEMENIKRIYPGHYLNYWESYKDVVYVEENYELGLMASTYASLLDAPLIIEGTDLDFS
jgi:hypothetical protein